MAISRARLEGLSPPQPAEASGNERRSPGLGEPVEYGGELTSNRGSPDRPPTVLLSYRTEDTRGQFTGSAIQRLRTVFSGMDDAAVRHAFAALEEAPEFLFDSVHQVKMPRWSSGGVAMLGDAAWCPNLYSGMGATSTLRGGAELGRALLESPDDLDAALAVWESRLRPFIRKHQRAARLKQQMFVPSSRPVEALRSVVLRLACTARERRLAKARATASARTRDRCAAGRRA
ncbi:hypothetical protein GCM10023224_01900 [Streptomonospora halophila]|uniref:FAD-binding domain-containing protein n=1 Tax=Streptomonospora halophila TaxID=427369 RepID=A0ABP9G2K1_9ACTN